MKKPLTLKKTKLFWAYYVGAFICLLAAVIFAPVWSNTEIFFKGWGAKVIDLLIAALIIFYLVTYLSKKVAKGGNGVIKILTIVEFVLLALIALGCILSQFKVFNFGGPCEIIGLIMWVRGAIEVYRAYYFKGTSAKYPAWLVAVAIGLVTFGTYLYVKPLFTANHLQWVLAVIMLILMICFIYAAIVTKPEKKKKPASATKPETKPEAEEKTEEKSEAKA